MKVMNNGILINLDSLKKVLKHENYIKEFQINKNSNTTSRFLEDDKMAVVKDEHRKKIKYSCAPCKSDNDSSKEPCIAACELQAITHSW